MSVQQQLQALEMLTRINPASLFQILPDTETPQDLEMVGYLMEKTPHDEKLASAFLERSHALGLDVVFARAYINTMLSSIGARAGLDGG